MFRTVCILSCNPASCNPVFHSNVPEPMLVRKNGKPGSESRFLNYSCMPQHSIAQLFWPNDQALGAAQPANDGGDKKGPAEAGLGYTQASRLLPGAALASAVQRVDVQAQGGVGLPTRTGRSPARTKTSHLLFTVSVSRGVRQHIIRINHSKCACSSDPPGNVNATSYHNNSGTISWHAYA